MFSEQSKKIKEARQQKYLDGCRKKLSNAAEKKMTTTFIGALDSIERVFGHIWGNKIPFNQKTKEQQQNAELWQELRTEILNNGNHQSRALLNEISEYVVQWKRYSSTFTITNRDQ